MVLFPTIPHLCVLYLYIHNNVHLKLNTYGYIMTHILAIYKPHIYDYYEQNKKCTSLTYYTVGLSWF